MIPIKLGWRLITLTLVLLASRLTAQPTGPTLHFDYGQKNAAGNPVNEFMYFVPLVSPVTVTVFTNAGNTQCARVSSYAKKASATSFSVSCDFDFTGTGSQQNVFDDAGTIRKHDQELKAGEVLKHQLGAINVEGNGVGSADITGVITNGNYLVNELKLHFNRNGRLSPVTIDLYDLRLSKGQPLRDNEMVARVNMLELQRASGIPKMEVTLAAINMKYAGSSAWQNFLGNIKGAAANYFLPP